MFGSATHPPLSQATAGLAFRFDTYLGNLDITFFRLTRTDAEMKAPWIIDHTTTVDVGGDDYFGPSVPTGAVTLTDSPYLTTVHVASLPRLAAPSFEAAIELSAEMARLPVHAPFPSAPLEGR